MIKSLLIVVGSFFMGAKVQKLVLSCIMLHHLLVSTSGACHGKFKLRQKYGEFLDCFVEGGSERWIGEDKGHITQKVYHENKSTEHVALIKKQEDGSWKAKD